ncbi:uncharacterized protein SCODWIG_01044 [Saccharomycodes ludwigii]|uniref:Pre-mRNA-splicing factor 18 n=2 Tax=Saccharomycodes ludwigii TaxID=36035 RepID=A0A376B3N8_9ASCO|nr:uncharacterized protein SCODWIG_01044 [Saccharomycodes ludwigii]
MIKDTEQLANDTSYVFTESDFQNLECLCSKSLQYIHYLLNLQEQCYSKTNNTADDKIADSDNDNICKETRINLFPLLIKLRKKTLDRNTLVTLSTTLYYLQLADYKSCLESYMKLSIGNVAWPIGVASIGIHQRSNHSRISNNFNASSNIMIDEETRLWITNIKRLITLLQESEKSV